MNDRVRRVGIALTALYVVLFAQLNVLHVLRADGYSDHPANTRAIVRDFEQPRGSIVAADGTIVARTVETPDSSFERRREYPLGPLFGHVAGFFSFSFGSEGVEDAWNDELTGRSLDVSLTSLSDLLLEDDERTGDVVLTIPPSVQQAAADALGGRKGAVVALDPRTGAVLALWSFPSFDPNSLAAHDQSAVQAARQALVDDAAEPLLARAWREVYFPGSTFKVVTGSAGLESGEVTPESPSYPVESSFTPPLTNTPIRNFGGSACGGTFFRVLQVSCNTAFARMGLDSGAEAMVEVTGAFGFRDRPPLDVSPTPVASEYPADPSFFERNDPVLAQSAIGQNVTKASPLQMALVAAAIANGGEMMAPYVVDRVLDRDGEAAITTEPAVWRRAVSEETAELMTQAMIGVVNGGTATRLAIPGVQVAGKTGTAELGEAAAGTHAWIVGFAPADAPRIAVAVMVEGDDTTGQQTGGRVAAPVARAVLEAALALPDPLADPGGDVPGPTDGP